MAEREQTKPRHQPSTPSDSATRANDEYDDRAVVEWIKDVAHRRYPSPAQESSDSVLEYIEARTGARLRSRVAVDSYLTGLELQKARAHRSGTLHGITRGTVLVGFAALTYLHYYYWEVKLQISALPRVEVFVPVSTLHRT